MSATNRGSVRSPNDFYPTPLSAFDPLVNYLVPNANYWEPACGDRRLIKVLNMCGFIADGNDLINGYNYLEDTNKYDCILTNPPYSLAFEFCQQAVKYSQHTYLLLRLNFLASIKRRAWFKSNEPSAIFVLSERPSFTGSGTDATDYAWIYWGNFIRGIFHL